MRKLLALIALLPALAFGQNGTISSWTNAGPASGGSAVAAITSGSITGLSTFTVADNVFTLQDDGDATKQVRFQLSGLTTGNTRTFTLPDASGTLLYSGGPLGTPSSATLSSATGLPVSTGISGFGTGIATALAINTGSAGAPVLFNGAGGTPSSLVLTNATGTPTLTTPVINGLSTGTGVASAATASTIVTRDSNANINVNTTLTGYTTTATAAGTTTLTVASTEQQFFTGATTQTVVLPVTSTLVLGQQFEIVNNSTGVVTLNSSGSNLVCTLATAERCIVTVILTSGTTAASWSIRHAPNYTAGGTLSVAGNVNPNPNSTWSLGSAAVKWVNIFINAAVMGTSGSIVKSPSDGTFRFSNSAENAGATFDTVSGNLTLAPNSAITAVTGALTATTTVKTGCVAVGSLPAAGSAGRRMCVTDQLTTCAGLGVAVTGGGAVTCPVFDNGSAWVGG